MYPVTNVPRMLFEEFSEKQGVGQEYKFFFMNTIGFGNWKKGWVSSLLVRRQNLSVFFCVQLLWVRKSSGIAH